MPVADTGSPAAPVSGPSAPLALPAGPELAADLAGREVAGLSGYALIDTITDWERLAGWAAAGQLAALAELPRRRPDELGRAGEPTSRGTLSVDEFAVDEVAAALHLARVTAGNRLDLAVELAGRLPGTSIALSRGEIDVPKARAVVEATRPLEPVEALAVESRVLTRAPRQTCGQLRASLARAAAAVHPVSAQERHERAVSERRVVLTPQPDGMAEIWALLPADGAVALYGALDTLARHQGSDDRTMGQRRADALVGLADVVASPGEAVGPATRRPGRPLVQVTVDLTVLLGLSQQPGELGGYGPIPAPMARRLAADGDWHRLVTDSVTGRLLDYSPTTYTPPAALARHVRARDAAAGSPAVGRRPPAATWTTPSRIRTAPPPRRTSERCAGHTTGSSTRVPGPSGRRRTPASCGRAPPATPTPASRRWWGASCPDLRCRQDRLPLRPPAARIRPAADLPESDLRPTEAAPTSALPRRGSPLL